MTEGATLMHGYEKMLSSKSNLKEADLEAFLCDNELVTYKTSTTRLVPSLLLQCISGYLLPTKTIQRKQIVADLCYFWIPTALAKTSFFLIAIKISLY